MKTPHTTPLRRGLNFLYDASAALAALMLVSTLLMVLAGIAQRYLPWRFYGTDAYAGYCMAASGFLALAHTLKKGEHIRVTLLLNVLRPPYQSMLMRFSLLAGAMLAGLFCYFSVSHTWQSWQLQDMSTGTDATPLWIPQLGMALGSVVFLIAVLDEFWLELSGHGHVADGAEGADGATGADSADGAETVEVMRHE
jgi:TRAP-type C4-dicarboxylate transport system permease small subunit